MFVGVTLTVYVMLAYNVIRAGLLYQQKVKDSTYTAADWFILCCLYLYQWSICAFYVFVYLSLRKLIKQVSGSLDATDSFFGLDAVDDHSLID